MTPEKQARLEFVQQRLLDIEEALLAGPPVNAINVGGMSVAFDRKGLLDERRELMREEQDLLRPNRRVRNIDLRNAFG